MEFKEFNKIPRLMKDIIITEKLDGTNAQILIQDGELKAGSRNRWLAHGADNYGFFQWCCDHKHELIGGLGEGRHYGEWWGQGIQRNYGLKEKRFTLFNPKLAESPLFPACCSVVPTLYHGPFSLEAIDLVMADLKRLGSRAAPEYMNPEGVVIYHTASGHVYKKTFDDNHKGN